MYLPRHALHEVEGGLVTRMLPVGRTTVWRHPCCVPVGSDIVVRVMSSTWDRRQRQQRRRRIVAVVILVAMLGAAVSGAVAGLLAVVRSDAAPVTAPGLGGGAVWPTTLSFADLDLVR
jgi:hypothetical protein